MQLSAEELADAIGATRVGVITGCVKTLRDNIVKRLGKDGVTVGRDDVLQHDLSGYRLRDWITVRSGDTLECPSNDPADDPADIPAVPENGLFRELRGLLARLKGFIE